MLISSCNLYPFVDESPFLEREYHEIYREIYGGPIYDVYEDDEIYKGDLIYDVYEENGFDNLVRAKIGRNLVYAEDFKHNQARAIFVQKQFYEEFGSCKICADLTCEDFAQHPTWKNRCNLYPFVDESPFLEREYHEIYREIYGGPIYDVYEDDEIYKGDLIYDVYEENGFDNLVRAKIGRNLVYAEDFKHNQARAIFVQKQFYEEFGSCKICADLTCEDFAQHPTWKNRPLLAPRCRPTCFSRLAVDRHASRASLSINDM
ncbi:hypothetical protein DY000_02003139 [Brassica cretica]|uniref:Uncharacterized protein n=1 Tax=Brassica cretica TaxID=69181 RepID=A0ABQ7CL74_BRACR|nr:hypothetical protein DY000_02003139 [Brassica cretica]